MQLEGEPPKRQASHGTVWTVGGAIPRMSFEQSQREGRSLPQEPAPARNFAINFASSKLSAGENGQQYLDRIAKALDIDQLRKTFNFTLNDLPKKEKHKLKSTEKTEWNGYSWTNCVSLEGMAFFVIESRISEILMVVDRKQINHGIPSAPFK